MTIGEAIELLKNDSCYECSYGCKSVITCQTVECKYKDAMQMAIKALEQEPILDKIRAEIDQKQYDFMDDKDYDEGIRFGLMLAYQIIDKYRKEAET